jgi:hypothetical protein
MAQSYLGIGAGPETRHGTHAEALESTSAVVQLARLVVDLALVERRIAEVQAVKCFAA